MNNFATDEERVEALKKWWKDNGMSLVFGVVIGLAAVFGWRYWVSYKQTRSEAASLTTMNMLAGLNRMKPDVAIRHGEQIRKDFGSTPYAVFAAMGMAKVKLRQGDHKSAIGYLQWALQHSDTEALKHVARIRLIRVLIDKGELKQAMTLIESAQPGRFLAAYEEQRGNILARQGKRDEALKAWQRALKALPADARIRAVLQMKIDDLAVRKGS